MYDFHALEEKWRKRWLKEKSYRTPQGSAPKRYVLTMFPYPSGSGLHMGHVRTYNATDIYGRYRRMCGERVLQPMGWDAFGLPAELFAIKNKVHPSVVVKKNTDTFRNQMQHLAFAFDWEREIATTDSSYYTWTQWIFLQFFKKGLVYESNEPINWCPDCKTGLANEDLDEDCCERCGTPVERKVIRQWVLRITDYAERLLSDLDTLPEWSDVVKDLQRAWIGKGEGYHISFTLSAGSSPIVVFTTRPDTLFGCSFLALSPEYRGLSKLLTHVENKDEVQTYQELQFRKQIATRTHEQEKSGIQLKGIHAIHPLTKEKIPIFVANYVTTSYGTGAIFGVPAHDHRDFAFADVFHLPVIATIAGEQVVPYEAHEGTLINSGEFDGMTVAEAQPAITKKAGGERAVTYRLQDWVFSRQRYWGEPIPLIHCKDCGVVPVPESELPITLPEIASYEPTGTGESPLAAMEDWVNVPCPSCGGSGKRETNTMPQWAGSCWYYLRYIDPHNKEAFLDANREKEWMPVDIYIGGIEHATRHLIYARFWHKFLYDEKLVSTKEPFTRLETVGIVHAHDGKKMSKRLGNVVDPLAFAKRHGVDATRLFVAFIAPFSQRVSWSDTDIPGVIRFLERIHLLSEKLIDQEPGKTLQQLQKKTIQQVGRDIETFRLNTAVSALMILLKALEKEPSRKVYETFIQLLAPFAPVLSEEIWNGALKHTDSIQNSTWPQEDTQELHEEEVVVVVQINGKVRDRLTVAPDTSQGTILSLVRESEKLKKYFSEDMTVSAFLPNTLISFSSKKR